MRGKLEKKISLITGLLESNNVDMVNAETQNLDRQLYEYTQTTNHYTELHGEGKVFEINHIVDEADEMVFQMKMKVCEWLQKQEDNMSVSSAQSRSSSGTTDGFSRRSTSSSKGSQRSGGSRQSAKASENQARIAGLKVKMSQLEKDMEKRLDEEVQRIKSEKQQDLKRQLENLNVDITIAEAKLLVYDEDEKDSVISCSIRKNVTGCAERERVKQQISKRQLINVGQGGITCKKGRILQPRRSKSQLWVM